MMQRRRSNSNTVIFCRQHVITRATTSNFVKIFLLFAIANGTNTRSTTSTATTTVTIHNPLTGKAAGLTGLHNDNKTTCPVRTDDYANPDWSFMLADKAASFEACPQATGLDLFAEQSL